MKYTAVSVQYKQIYIKHKIDVDTITTTVLAAIPSQYTPGTHAYTYTQGLLM